MISVMFITSLFSGKPIAGNKRIVTKYGPASFQDSVTILDVLKYFGCEEMADDHYLWEDYKWGSIMLVNGIFIRNNNRKDAIVKSFDTSERYFINLIERADPD